MRIEPFGKAAFVVIGKEGSTEDGPGFIQKLWADANAHFAEVEPLAKRDEQGNLVGIWGAMTNCARTFQPWEADFTKGLYLAGVECRDDAEAPEGWTKWTIPGFRYLCAAWDHDAVFPDMIRRLQEQHIPLVGAVQDFTDPKTGKNTMLFPVGLL